jgi:metal-responsive CopG/Arc/MetJ family transcriptional regulator
MSENKKQNLEGHISIRMSSEMLEALDRYSKEMGGIPRTNLIKIVLQEWITKREKEKERDRGK